jgi:opacity protein-like surface antigen
VRFPQGVSLSEPVKAGTLTIKSTYYNLESGKVDFLAHWRKCSTMVKEVKSRMKIWSAFTLSSRLLIGIICPLGGTLFAGSEITSDSKDYSKETPPQLEKSWCQPPPPWEFRIGVPGWLSGFSGDFGVKGVDTEQDVDFTDILKKLDMIASGLLYARYHRWEIFADGQYIKLSDTAPLRGFLSDSARVSLKSAFANASLGYRLINCDKGFLSLFGGARYNYMSGDFHLRGALLPGRRASGSIDWVDPVVGLRGRVRVWKPISLYGEGDVGGFDANSDSAFQLERQGLTIVRVPKDGSDWSYQVQGGLEIQVTRWMWSQLGWRYLKYDYVTGGFVNKTDISGPFIQGGINF